MEQSICEEGQFYIRHVDMAMLIMKNIFIRIINKDEVKFAYRTEERTLLSQQNVLLASINRNFCGDNITCYSNNCNCCGDNAHCCNN